MAYIGSSKSQNWQKSLLALAVAGIVHSSTALAAADQARVVSQAWTDYSLSGHITSPLFGQEVSYYDELNNPVYVPRTVDFNRTLDSASAYSSGYGVLIPGQQPPVPPAAEYDKTLVGDSAIGASDAHARGYAYTDWGHNHASTSTSYTPIDSTVDGEFLNPVTGTSVPMSTHTTTSLYSYATSQWEELYKLGNSQQGGTGTASMGFQIDGSLTATQEQGSYSSIYYSLNTFNNERLLYVYASISSYQDADGNWQSQWWSNIFSDGVMTSDSGYGDFTIDRKLHAEYEFTNGDPLYLNSYLQVYSNGNASSDFRNTVSMESLVLPENTLVYAMSGTSMSNFGLSFAGNGNGTVCASTQCVSDGSYGGTGTGGGGGSVVPLPSAVWLFASSLMGLGLGARRKA